MFSCRKLPLHKTATNYLFYTHESATRLASFGATIPEKLICFSGGGAPTAALIVTESPEWTYKHETGIPKCIKLFSSRQPRF